MARLLQIAHDHLSPAGAVADQFVQRGYDITELLVVPKSGSPTPVSMSSSRIRPATTR